MCSFAGNVTYPKATDLQDAAERVPDELLLVETDSPYLVAPAGARQAQRAGQRDAHRPLRGRAPRDGLRGAGGAGGAQRRPRLRVVTAEPRQASLRRLRQFDVRPNRELGQNFLVDDNLLGGDRRRRRARAGRRGARGGRRPGRAVRVPGAARGHLHVVEVDPRLREPMEDALAPFGNATLHQADAVALDLAALEPLPGKVVANLPYGVAATVLLKSLAELPEASLLVAMVQREVAERLAASPAEGQGLRRHLGAGAALVRRQGAAAGAGHGVPPAAGGGVRAGAAAPPRAGAAAGGGGAGARGLRPPAQGAGRLAGAGAGRARRGSASARARPWSSSATRPTRAPSACRRPTTRGWPSSSAPARDHRDRARQGQPRPAGRPPARRRPARAVLAVRSARAGRRADLRAGRAGRGGRARRGGARTWSRPRSTPSARAPPSSRCAWRSRSASRWPAAWAAAAPTPRRPCARPTGWPASRSSLDELRTLGAAIGADVPSQVEPGPVAGHRARARGWSRSSCRRCGWCWCPAARGCRPRPSTPSSTGWAAAGRRSTPSRCGRWPAPTRHTLARSRGERPRAGGALAAPRAGASTLTALRRPGRARRAAERLGADGLRDLRRPSRPRSRPPPRSPRPRSPAPGRPPSSQ